jgi:selenocysteine-specific elongation factor
MYIVGTAGHVDHGKSTLIEAITGTHPDRLQEERDREMSIVLGFDSFELPDGRGISVVDVPGHRDFIENMLSGIGSIDACLLVIAADEGVMPQTREHLDILHLLEVDKGLVALTKVDLVEDKDWLDLVEIEIRELLSATALKGVPIVRVSAKEKTGINDLLNTLGAVLEDQPPRIDLGRPRLFVDRTFVMPGFGSVVTGTLLDGTFREGDEIEILPGKKTGRIRGMQNHSLEVNEIGPGNRVAMNISGVDNKDINRGDVITHPGSYKSTRRLDVSFNFLPGIDKPLNHDLEGKLFIGADETLARVRLLGTDSLIPGETALLQLEVEDPVVAVRGDRFILRRPSPSETLGGGIVIDPFPPYRHKRFDKVVLDRLESISGGDPIDVLIQAISSTKFALWKEIIEISSLPEENARELLTKLVQDGIVLEIGKKSKKIVCLKSVWQALLADLKQNVERYHDEFPLRAGMSLEELKSQSQISETVFREAIDELIHSESVHQIGPVITLKGFEINFPADAKKLIKNLLDLFDENPTQPPSVTDCKAAVGEDIYGALLVLNELNQISADVVFRPESYQKMITQLIKKINKDGPITVAQTRDMFGSSRKYMLAFLERLDAEGVTVRDGDVRRLKDSKQ